MSDEAIAQARRLHHHVMNGGSVTALDMSRLVQAMEQMQAERNDLAHEQIASTEWQTRYQRAKAQRDEARVERDTVTADWKAEIEMHREEHRRRMHAEAERDRLKGLVEDWKEEPVGGIVKFGVLYLSPERVASIVDPLKAEVHRLRDALKDIESPPIDVLCHGSWEAAEWMIERAANALKESDRD